MTYAKKLANNELQDDKSKLMGLTLAALGVVYGDIGTSPLYAVRECFNGEKALAVTTINVLGILSLIFWSLIIIVTIKYIMYVMRADNKGEGGILVLSNIVSRLKLGKKNIFILGIMGLFGAALLYGDGMITPAISVLSAVEGLTVATPLFKPYIIPIALSILITLFLIQKRGTAGVGAVFGPVMLMWFFTLTLLGLVSIVHHPAVLYAFNPWYGFAVFMKNGWLAFTILGTVFLVVTGGEALYADMGHFGRSPIKIGWFLIVLPSLIINYFGQGALLLSDPGHVGNLFYRMAPSWALYPLVALATMATVIASQAVISGAFSLTRQAVQLGLSPRLAIIHTSNEKIGQVYVPAINWALLIGTIALVLGFKKSGNLAAAYGVAVSATMVITTLLMFLVTYRKWKWPFPASCVLSLLFISIDCAFFGSNIAKIFDGGWVPILIASLVFMVMTTWQKGRRLIKKKLDAALHPLDKFIKDTVRKRPPRVSGAAIYLNGSLEGTPGTLIRNFRHNRILHKTIAVLSVITEEIPHVPENRRIEVEPLGKNFFRIKIYYGFSEHPNVPEALAELTKDDGIRIDTETASYFLGRETLRIINDSTMSKWRKRFFDFLSRNSRDATKFFMIPPDQVIELGVQIKF